MEKLGFSAIVMVLGLMIVFVGLVILIFAVKALSAILASDRKKKAEAPAPVPVQAPAAPAPVSIETAEEETDTQLIAVITAAILACEGVNKRLVVRSVRRMGSAWSAAAREETLNF